MRRFTGVFKDWIYRQDKKTVFWYLFMCLAGGVCVMVYFRMNAPAKAAGDAAQAALREESAAGPGAARSAAEAETAKAAREKETEERLESILSLIYGAGRVKVMITLSESEGGDVIAVNSSSKNGGTTEKDSEGGTREVFSNESEREYVTIKGSNGAETPLIIKPQGYIIEGVAIVAEGGDNIAVKDALTRAAYTVLGIPAHKVQVAKMRKQ